MKPNPSALRAELEKATAVYESRRDLAAPYLLSRGITKETAERFRLGFTGGIGNASLGEAFSECSRTGQDPLPGDPAGRVSIPSLSFGGVVSLKFRAVDDSTPKYLGRSTPARMFNSRAILEAEDEIHISEGELDAVILEQCGLHAVGVPGASAFKPHYARCFTGFQKVYVWQDSDEPGKEFGSKVLGLVNQAQRVILRPEAGVKDVNALYLEGGRDAILEAFQ